MSDSTPNLALPYIIAAQAQKHVTHNEAIRALDVLVQLAVEDRDLSAPPASPANGDAYIVASGATGTWSGQVGKIAAFQDGAWEFYTPSEGWLAWVRDEDKLYVHDGTGWDELPTGGGAPVSFNPVTGGLLGVNATADTTNRLTISSPATLFNHEGAGHQLKLNKAASGDTASLLYQTNWSGRAEIGTTGDDDFHFKVSPNGTTWFEAMVINRTNGHVTFPSGGGGSHNVDGGHAGSSYATIGAIDGGAA